MLWNNRFGKFLCNNQYLYIALVELKMWLKVKTWSQDLTQQLGEHLSSKIIVETKKEYLILWQPIDYAATVIQIQFQLLSLKYNLSSSPGNLSDITQMQLQNFKNASSDPYCISNVIFLEMAPFQKQYWGKVSKNSFYWGDGDWPVKKKVLKKQQLFERNEAICL